MIENQLDTISNITQISHHSQNPTRLYHGKLLLNDSQKPIFIKQLKALYSQNDYQQFCQEITILQACQSLAIKNQKQGYGIPQLLHHDINHETPFFFTPFYQGKTLKNLIINNELGFEQTLDSAIGLCYILDKIHCLGYLHGDIKPSNIFLTENNQVILLDFGLSQSINHQTPKNYTFGTPAYMSPEQFHGLALTPQSDYYSLGVVLYEIFTGKPPFIEQYLENWATAHCQQPIPQMGNNLNLSAKNLYQLDQIFQQLLAKKPKQRYHNLQAVINALSQLAF